MGSVLHGSARTTPRVRAEVQASQASTRSLAAEYGLNPNTVKKWRGRTTTADAPMGPKAPKSTVPTPVPDAWRKSGVRRDEMPIPNMGVPQYPRRRPGARSPYCQGEGGDYRPSRAGRPGASGAGRAGGHPDGADSVRTSRRPSSTGQAASAYSAPQRSLDYGDGRTALGSQSDEYYRAESMQGDAERYGDTLDYASKCVSSIRGGNNEWAKSACQYCEERFMGVQGGGLHRPQCANGY